MDLTHRFSVPTAVDATWTHFQDIAALGECFPGATVDAVEGDTFSGTAKIKLGPIAMLYKGTGTFTEKDEAGRRMVVEAKGKDKRGNGTAGATVTLTMSEVSGGTDVEVVTDLQVTGKPAQFGRGVMQDVSDKLLGQFVDCLEQRLAGPPAAEPEPAVAQAPAPAPAPAPAAAPEPAAAAAAAAGSASASDPAPVTGSGSPGSSGDALDLGATVLPVLARNYWKHALGAVLALLVLRKLLRCGCRDAD